MIQLLFLILSTISSFLLCSFCYCSKSNICLIELYSSKLKLRKKAGLVLALFSNSISNFIFVSINKSSLSSISHYLLTTYLTTLLTTSLIELLLSELKMINSIYFHFFNSAIYYMEYNSRLWQLQNNYLNKKRKVRKSKKR